CATVEEPRPVHETEEVLMGGWLITLLTVLIVLPGMGCARRPPPVAMNSVGFYPPAICLVVRGKSGVHTKQTGGVFGRSEAKAEPKGSLEFVAGGGKEEPKVAPTDAERKLVDLVNLERQKQKLPPLKVVPLLSQTARAHATNMAKQGKMAH